MIPLHQRNVFSQLLPLLFIIFIDTVGYFIVIPVIIHIFVHNEIGLLPVNASTASRDWLFSITLMLSPLAFIICSPIIGHFSDRYGRKKALSYALVAACIGFALPIVGILKKSVSLILIGRLISGASSSSQPVAQAGITDFTRGKERALYLSLIGAAMTVGMVIGPIAGGFLSSYHVTTPYWFALGLSILNIIAILIFYKSPQQFHDASHTLPIQQRIVIYTRLVTQNKVGVLMLAFLFIEIAWSQYYQAAFLTLTQHFHYSMTQVTTFTAYVGLWMALGLTVIYKYLVKRYTIESILKISVLIAAIAFMLCNIPRADIQWIMMIPATIFFGTAYPSILHSMSQHTDAHNQGYVLGFASTVLGAAWMVTGLLAGPLVAHSFMWPNIIASAAMLVALLLVLVGTHRSKV